MCPRNLKEHLDLNVKEDTGYEELRKLTIKGVDLHLDRGGVMPVDVGNLHTKDSEYDDYNTQEYTSEHTDASAPSTVCWRCGGVGHMASQCVTSSGERKGGLDMKGKGERTITRVKERDGTVLHTRRARRRATTRARARASLSMELATVVASGDTWPGTAGMAKEQCSRVVPGARVCAVNQHSSSGKWLTTLKHFSWL